MNDSSSLTANALASASAGICGRILTHPLDTTKARLQAVYQHSNSSGATLRRPYRGPIDVLIRTARNEGLAGLYRGFGIIVVGGTPGTVMYLTSYEYAKTGLSRLWEESRAKSSPSAGNDSDDFFLIHFASGMIAETIACIVYVPVDVVKERLQVQHSSSSSTGAGQPTYKGSWDALKQISKTEGLSGIYRGYLATLGSFGPYSALYFVCYERFKTWTRRYLAAAATTGHEQPNRYNNDFGHKEKIDLPFQWILLCSAAAGVLASWITSPLDMAKLRLQVQRGSVAKGATNTTAYRGVVDCLRHTYQTQGGLPALFRGAGARVLHFTPSMTITMTCYETFRSFFAKSF